MDEGFNPIRRITTPGTSTFNLNPAGSTTISLFIPPALDLLYYPSNKTVKTSIQYRLKLNQVMKQQQNHQWRKKINDLYSSTEPLLIISSIAGIAITAFIQQAILPLAITPLTAIFYVSSLNRQKLEQRTLLRKEENLELVQKNFIAVCKKIEYTFAAGDRSR